MQYKIQVAIPKYTLKGAKKSKLTRLTPNIKKLIAPTQQRLELIAKINIDIKYFFIFVLKCIHIQIH
ncbi:hypothetical protein AVBRAN_1799 [Campylobacter sp. RM12651]|nr:hypothetical protein AVBRAN_1799 [Campylobacter sp. RM12651]